MSLVIDFFKLIGPFVSSRANRARIRGARVEVCAYILSRAPSGGSILLVKSAYGNWMPLQEGVRVKEGLEDTLWRGLAEEIGLTDQKPLYVRTCRHLGRLELPPERHKERSVADDVGDGPMSHITMKRKDYWAFYLIVANHDDIHPMPNGTEVLAAKWYELDEARREIERSNRPEKAALLIKGLEPTRHHLFGGKPAGSPAP